MRTKLLNIALCLLLSCSLLLAACEQTDSSESAAQTLVAGTFQAMTQQGGAAPLATATPTATVPPEAGGGEPPAPVPTATVTPIPLPTLLPTATPVAIPPVGSYIPYAADQCEVVRSYLSEAIGVTMSIETTTFSDRMTGGTGTACRIVARGNRNTLSMDTYVTLGNTLLNTSWVQDGNYGAGGATGMMDGFRRGGALGILYVHWQPSADANCPSNQPISACNLAPEQQLYEAIFDIATVVSYLPMDSVECLDWLNTFQTGIPVPLVMEIVSFQDLEGYAGTACQIHGTGTGLDFESMAQPANVFDMHLTTYYWTLVNGADGPMGTTREYTNGSQTAVVHISVRPSADANCPTNQPISACNLLPQQKLYDITVAFGQR